MVQSKRRYSTLPDADTPEGRFLATITEAVMTASWELHREIISLRTKEAQAKLRAQGIRIGPPPLGYRCGSETDVKGRTLLEKVASEQATIDRVFELRSVGRTLREIAETLTAEGRKTKRGGDWHASTVRLILAQPPMPAQQRKLKKRSEAGKPSQPL